MRYKILEARSRQALVNEVEIQHREEGWCPQGGICVIQYEAPGGVKRMWYAQAVVCYREKTDETHS